MSWVIGTISYYCDCLGGDCDNGTGGACQDCRDNYAHLAWPKLSTTGCDYSCGGHDWKACGNQVLVVDDCKETQQWAEIHDCCTCSPHGCSLEYRCNGVLSCCGAPIADLTESLYIALHGSLADGRTGGSILQ